MSTTQPHSEGVAFSLVRGQVNSLTRGQNCKQLMVLKMYVCFSYVVGDNVFSITIFKIFQVLMLITLLELCKKQDKYLPNPKRKEYNTQTNQGAINIQKQVVSKLMIIVQSFYKRNLISKDHCGIFQISEENREH
ncbi:Hypothetical_protein [Hexamita inflata]|uniref:Hypothetical_protein n=1 Tax=Hexamita inflata TaxID=28002 RepID=A0AA86UVI5_9EUKA|nr:Hypothetical protein HINF_LOCUS47042 [Hexamita inflata]CAI9969519.1 Hypothetical protein HINF_LOCUS57164 [Hexamita inflata]